MKSPLTVTDAAKELDLSRSRILAFIRAGRLAAVKVGMQFLIRPQDLDAVRIRPKGGRPSKCIVP